MGREPSASEDNDDTNDDTDERIDGTSSSTSNVDEAWLIIIFVPLPVLSRRSDVFPEDNYVLVESGVITLYGGSIVNHLSLLELSSFIVANFGRKGQKSLKTTATVDGKRVWGGAHSRA
jgi:hypothetical protein